MPPRIDVDEKFSCFAFDQFSTRDDLVNELVLDAHFWVLRAFPLAFEEFWHDWLGSLQIRAVRGSNLVLLVTAPSASPDILDHENQELTQELNHFLHGLLLQGVPWYEKGFSVTGANVRGEIQIRQFGDLKGFHPTWGFAGLQVGRDEIDRAVSLASRLRQVYRPYPDWSRLARGLSTLLRGSEETEGPDRLHQFVRAFEALIRPEISRTRRQFIYRAQTFATPGPAAGAALGEIFDIRSHVEHLHSPLDALSGTDDERTALALRRTRQIDRLCRFALVRVLESDELFEQFRTDAGIDAFWALRDHERRRMVGNQIDLSRVT